MILCHIGMFLSPMLAILLPDRNIANTGHRIWYGAGSHCANAALKPEIHNISSGSKDRPVMAACKGSATAPWIRSDPYTLPSPWRLWRICRLQCAGRILRSSRRRPLRSYIEALSPAGARWSLPWPERW